MVKPLIINYCSGDYRWNLGKLGQRISRERKVCLTPTDGLYFDRILTPATFYRVSFTSNTSNYHCTSKPIKW